jgi:hypothetical protein
LAYPNLKAEIARKGLTLVKILEDGRIKCTKGTLSLKINGKYPFTFAEAVALKAIIGSELPLEELFQEGEE